jgi:tetratricopeptide (TPR) repeat protein
VKSLLVTLGGGVVLGCALLACGSAPPAVQPVAPVQPVVAMPALSPAGPSPSLRPPVSPRFAGEVPALPEPPSQQPLRPAAVTLGGVPVDPSGADSAGQPLRLLEPAAPGRVPSAQAQYALIDRVAAPGGSIPAAAVTPRASAGAAPPAAPPAARPAPEPKAPGPKVAPAQPATDAARSPPGSTTAAIVPQGASRGAAAATATAASVAHAREVLARAGDPIEIAFDGRGWLYLGLSAAEPGRNAGVAFQGGGSSGGRSVFGFKALEHGQYTLRFQLQDNLTGGLLEEAVRLSVLPDKEFSARLAGQTVPQASAVPGALDPDRVAAAERLYSLGEYDRAVAAFLDAYQEGDPYLNDRIAASYAATGDHLAAEKYYRRNLQTSGPLASQAVAGLMRAAVAGEDTALLLEQFPALLRTEGVQIGQELLEVGRWQAAAGRYAVALEAFQEYMRRYPAGRELDEICFLLAQLLEAESPFRDLRGARDLYHRVYEDFPESPLAAPAQVRRDYLNRHFFQIR